MTNDLSSFRVRWPMTEVLRIASGRETKNQMTIGNSAVRHWSFDVRHSLVIGGSLVISHLFLGL
jgi:hypothetical protein